ncbi:MAG: HAD family hydrolase [Microcystaceae cyanobacterium]
MPSLPKNKTQNQLFKLDLHGVKAVIFDVDGTLYNQQKLRSIMLMELLKYYLTHPRKLQDLKIIRDFRREREKHAFDVVVDLEKAQYDWAAKISGVSPERVHNVVQKWIFKIPLKYIPSCSYPKVLELFEYLSRRGIATGIFSDYPAEEKLATLGLSPCCIVSATDRNVGRLKPNPKGLFVVAETLGVAVEHCLFIGDRDERDGECARRAGMPYLILKM